MDKGTLVGLFLTAILLVGAMALGGSLLMYVDPASVLIVFGGTIAATLIKEQPQVVMGAFKIAKNALVDPRHEPEQVIETIVRLAKLARANGVLALENEEMPTPFMKKGLRLVCDGVAAEEVEETLLTEKAALLQRHKRGQAVFKFMAATAPSFGMIGTLIGLVAMLQTLDNPSAIGPAMAVALLTTLYGALIAFAVCTPIAEKLALRTSEESLSMSIALNGFVYITRGDKPLLIQEKLVSFLEPKKKAAVKTD